MMNEFKRHLEDMLNVNIVDNRFQNFSKYRFIHGSIPLRMKQRLGNNLNNFLLRIVVDDDMAVCERKLAYLSLHTSLDDVQHHIASYTKNTPPCETMEDQSECISLDDFNKMWGNV